MNLTQEAREKLPGYAKEVVFYEDIPENEAEMIRRISDADAVLISYTSQMGRRVLEAAPQLRYVGMCCSLYSEKSANVDIAAARELGITVHGVRDYGDQGVGEYAVSELVRYLHGFGGKQWKMQPMELTDLKVGVIGLGASGTVVAEALAYFGAEVCYFSRTRKYPEKFQYLPLNELLEYVDVAFTCLTKNTVLLYEEQFRKFGNHKILFNTCIGPSFDQAALENWLSEGSNEFFCDMVSGLGPDAERLRKNPHITCAGKASGTTVQAMVRLSEKVLLNLQSFLKG